MEDSPALTVLARRGARDVIATLVGGANHVRGIAQATSRPVATVARIVRDLEALGVVESLRPGRDKQILWRAGPLADWMAALAVPDLRGASARAFVEAYQGPGTCHRWAAPDDEVGDPHTRTRVVILTEQEEEALDAVGAALDAVEAAGWPAPEVTVQDAASLGDDPISVAMTQPIASTM